MAAHEYSVIGGPNRARIGQAIGAVAAGLSAAIWLLGSILLGLLPKAGIPMPTIVKWPVTASLIYGGLYLYFNHEFWKLNCVSKLLKVPNLAGEWACEGESINSDGTPGVRWEGSVKISQSWDKVYIVLTTAQSSSASISASLVHDVAEGYRLMYSYRNQPRIDQPQLYAHLGYATFLFDDDLQTASGEYFNGNGRYTFGTMKLSRKQ